MYLLTSILGQWAVAINVFCCRKILLAAAAVCCLLSIAQAKESPLTAPSRTSTDSHRIALVIGNDTYRTVSTLSNGRADASAVAKALEQVGFHVTLKLDADEKDFKAALRKFKNDVKGGDEAVFYYAGHGVQLGAANYLLPVDIRGDNEDQVKDDAIPLQRVLDDLQDQKARFSLAIIDACRNNPFRQSGRAIGGRGLAPTTAATGQMILFSAGAGQQALDRLGDNDRDPNGLFTRVFLKEMNRSDIPVDRVLRNVREQVVRQAKTVGHEQVPALYDQALGEFYFRVNSAALTGNSSAQTSRTDSDVEEEQWANLKDSREPLVFTEYLRLYPKGKHALLARATLARLNKESDRQNATKGPSNEATDTALPGKTSYSSPAGKPIGARQSDRFKADQTNLAARAVITRDFIKFLGKGDLESAEKLLQQGADINCRYCLKNGLTPLMAIASDGRPNDERLRWLLDNGASINEKDEEGKTALYHLVASTQLGEPNYRGEDLRLLLERGADPKIKNKNSVAPLHVWVNKNADDWSYNLEENLHEFKTVVNRLLELGADINGVAIKGYTPIIIAASSCNVDVVTYLISKGADASHKTQAGESVLGLAEKAMSSRYRNGCADVVRFLRSMR